MAAPIMFMLVDDMLEDITEKIAASVVWNRFRQITDSNNQKRKDVPRIIGYVENTIPRYLEEDYRTHYRVSKRVFEIIVDRVTPGLTRNHGGGIEETSPHKQVLVFLWYMANQDSKRELGTQFGIGTSTTHNILKRVFRKLVCDNNMLIRHCYSGWPGCTHDARVLRNSSLIGFNGRNMIAPNKFIIADSAYPLYDWLITPFRDNGRLSAQQKRFNKVLSSSKQIVERCIGHLKGRFRRLREITLHEPYEIVLIITARCILHNLCIIHDDVIEDFIDNQDDHLISIIVFSITCYVAHVRLKM